MKSLQSSFRRYENKYILNASEYQSVRDGLDRYMLEDEYARSTVCSVYYDTPDFSLARKSAEHPVYKEKLRLRSYGVPGADDEVFIEIKKKFDGVVYKRREVTRCDRAEAYLSFGGAPETDSQIWREIDWFRRSHTLEPKAYVAYEREALSGIDDPGLRVTFDKNVRWRDYDAELTMGDYGRQLLPPEMRLMEVKLQGAAPLWLANLLSEAGVFPAGFSKYVSCCKLMLSEKKMGNGVSDCA